METNNELELKEGVFYIDKSDRRTILRYEADNLEACMGYWRGEFRKSLWAFYTQCSATQIREATYEELEALGTEHRPYSKYLLKSVDEEIADVVTNALYELEKEAKVYTIKDLSEGRVATFIDGEDSINDLMKLLRVAFPLDNYINSENDEFEDYIKDFNTDYFFANTIPFEKGNFFSSIKTDLPTQPISVFLKELEGSKESEEELQPVSVGEMKRRANETGNIFQTSLHEPKMRTFGTGATRNLSNDKLDFDGFLSPLAIEEFAKYMHKHRMQADGNLRPSDNWQKGIPVEEYMKSMYRHFFDTWKNHRGHETPEDQITNLCAVIFNAQGMLHELLKAK